MLLVLRNPRSTIYNLIISIPFHFLTFFVSVAKSRCGDLNIVVHTQNNIFTNIGAGIFRVLKKWIVGTQEDNQTLCI